MVNRIPFRWREESIRIIRRIFGIIRTLSTQFRREMEQGRGKGLEEQETIWFPVTTQWFELWVVVWEGGKRGFGEGYVRKRKVLGGNAQCDTLYTSSSNEHMYTANQFSYNLFFRVKPLRYQLFTPSSGITWLLVFILKILLNFFLFISFSSVFGIPPFIIPIGTISLW